MPRPSPTALLLQRMVRIPSVNPADNPGTTRTGEKACALFIAGILKKIGGKVRFQQVELGRPNVIGIFRGRGKITRRVLLAPHTDTVSVAGMTIEPFGGKISKGRLYGRGASDTKGPMAAMLQALSEFVPTKEFREGSLEITFAGLMGEEAGNTGALAWARACPKYNLAIIAEPTNRKIVYTHKGAAWLQIETQGRAAHASLPEKGRNAIQGMEPVLAYFRDTLPEKIGKLRHPDLGRSTVSITTISGGSKANIIPGNCKAQADLRFLPGMKIADILKIIRRDFKKSGIAAAISIHHGSQPLHTNPRHSLIQQILPHTRGLTTAPWFCDAAVFAARGIPSVALGPGSIHQAHTSDEFIDLSELEKGKDGYKAILLSLTDS